MALQVQRCKWSYSFSYNYTSMLTCQSEMYTHKPYNVALDKPNFFNENY